MLAPQFINMQGENQETPNTIPVSGNDLRQPDYISSSGTLVKNYATSPAIATVCYQPSATSSAELINSSTEKTIHYIPTPMDKIKVNQGIDKCAVV